MGGGEEVTNHKCVLCSNQMLQKSDTVSASALHQMSEFLRRQISELLKLVQAAFPEYYQKS